MKRNEKGFSAVEIVLVLVIVGLIGFISWYVWHNHQDTDKNLTGNTTSVPNAGKTKTDTKTTPTTAKLTNGQIFQEVSNTFNLKRESIVYFRIFGQDKVQYNTGPGTTFAYKTEGKWHIALKDSQSVVDCSDLTNVPEKYRPACIDEDSNLKYADANKGNVNYPIASAVAYIGQ